MARAYCYIDVDRQMARIANSLTHVVEGGAEDLRDEIRSSIGDSPLPAAAGQPPHSAGPYREAWKSGRARIRGFRVVAWTFNTVPAANGRSLARILEDGVGPVHPHPHFRPAIPIVQRRTLDKVT